MTLYEALTLALNSGGADSLELLPVSGIFIAFNSDDVIIDQSGDCYDDPLRRPHPVHEH